MRTCPSRKRGVMVDYRFPGIFFITDSILAMVVYPAPACIMVGMCVRLIGTALVVIRIVSFHGSLHTAAQVFVGIRRKKDSSGMTSTFYTPRVRVNCGTQCSHHGRV